MSVPVIAIDARGEIIYANDSVERTFGWEPRALIGRSLTELLPVPVMGFFLERFDSFMAEMSPGPIGVGASFHGRRRDGSEFPAEITVLPVRGPGGLAVFAAVVDVSYRQVLRDLVRGRDAVQTAEDQVLTTG